MTDCYCKNPYGQKICLEQICAKEIFKEQISQTEYPAENFYGIFSSIKNKISEKFYNLKENFFYVKECPGENGKELKIYKFRTMKKRADEILEQRIKEYGLNKNSKPNMDDQITPAGKFLRKYWLDEIPQVYNLIKRDIKLIGIRPEKKETEETFPEDIRKKLKNTKRALLGIQYSLKNKDFENLKKLMRNYLNEFEKNPIKTDAKYFFKIIYGMAFYGRSS